MLKISKKADYALMALQHIATVQFGDVMPGRVVNTKEIAEEYNIPLELLAKVLQTLAKNGLIESHNGPKGGYVLARRAHQITIAQILESIEGWGTLYAAGKLPYPHTALEGPGQYRSITQ
jgi:Rrf2 family protein